MTDQFITIKVFDKNGKGIRVVASRKTKRFYYFLKAENFLNCLFQLRVRYANGNVNEGDYSTKKELIFALKAFTKPD